MANRTEELKEENERLKGEIETLQRALEGLYREHRDKRRLKRLTKWRFNKSQRTELITHVLDKVQSGVFSPPKTSVSHNRSHSFTHSNAQSRSNSQTKRKNHEKRQEFSPKDDQNEEFNDFDEILMQEIRTLQRENDTLRAKIRQNKSQRRISSSKIVQKPHFSRIKHCKTCDKLLFVGFSTKHCGIHGHLAS